jgi:LmbE family N-acetylglucosaminyl deacetylase
LHEALTSNPKEQVVGRALILAPHPGDEAIATGGLIAHLFTLGWRVNVVVVAVGTSRQLGAGWTQPGPRLEELRRAQRLGGYTADVVYVSDDFMRLDALPRKELCDEIGRHVDDLRPDVIVVPPASSCDQDHRAVAEAAITALRPGPNHLRHFVPVVLEADDPHWWRIDGGRPTPNFFVPLTDAQLELKMRLIAAHASQDRPDPCGQSTDNLRRIAASYGVEIGGGYAEAYRILRARADLCFGPPLAQPAGTSLSG